MKYMQWLVIISLFIATPAMAQVAFTATTETTTQPTPSVTGVWVDLSALLAETDLAANDVTAVTVRPSESDDMAPVPARMEATGDAHRVLWQVPAATSEHPTGTRRSFELTFWTSAPSQRPQLPDDAQVNLLGNGDFEQLNDSGAPKHALLRDFDENFRVIETDTGRALAFNASRDGRGPTYRTPWINVQPNHAYELSYRYKVQDAKPHPRYGLTHYGWIYFQGRDDAEVPRLPTGRARSSSTDGWRTFKTTIDIPAQAKALNFDLRTSSTEPYSVLIDDVRIAPATLPQITAIQMVDDERRISLRATGQGIYRFDLGPEGAPVWDGFDPLTPEMEYDAERGFGFTRLTRNRSRDAVRPEALSRDYIAAGSARLRVDLPNGEYDIRLLTGSSLTGHVVYWLYFNQRLTLGSDVVYRNDQTPAEFFKSEYLQHYDSFWQPEMSYYDTFVASRFKTHRFSSTVTDGKLDIRWRNMPVNAIVIAPRDKRDAMEDEWAQLSAQRRRATRIEPTPGPDESMPAVTDAERARGYVLFRRPASERVYPSSRPTSEQRIDELRGFAAPGQMRSVHFSLTPLKDLGDVTVRPTALRSEDATIESDAVTVRVARYIFKEVGRTGHTKAAYTHEVAPFPLDQRESVNVDQGVTWSWWAQLDVPADAPAGVYEGALAITPESGEAFELPLKVRVLPFELEPLPISQGYYYFPTEPWYSTFWGANVLGADYRDDSEVRRLIREQERGELAFMKSLGLNSVAFSDDLRKDLAYEDGEVRLEPDNRLALWMDLYAEAEMGPMPFYGFQPIGSQDRLTGWFSELDEPFTPEWNRAYRSLVRNIEAARKERGWPEILWYISDELSNHGEAGAKRGKRLAQLLDDMDDIRTIASMNGEWEHIMVPHLSLSMPNIAFPITRETVRMVRDAGSELWLYNCGSERITLGLYPWRVDAGGRFQWHYRSMVADPWDDLDGSYGESAYSISLPGPDGPVPTLRSEAVRAAINDHRYAATLEHAIEAARDEPDKREIVAQAEQFLDDLRQRIPVDVRTLVGYQVDPREAGAAVGGEFKNTDALDRVRWAMASLIMKLREGE